MLRRHVKRLIKKLTENNYQTLNTIEISNSRFLSNLELFHKLHPNFSIIPVLKANAYGHGIEPVAHMANGFNCAFLAVDGYFEAAQIRDITNHKILVLGYIKPSNVKLLDVKKCSFVIQDIEGLKAFAALKKPVKVHLEINSGMNRLGLQPEEIVPYLETLKKLPNLELEGVMTHLADADNEIDNSFTNKQQTLFDNMIELIRENGFNPKYIHIAQTAGSTKVQSKYANAMRIGIGSYGINPLGENDPHFKDLTDLRPVLELKSTVIKVIHLNAGDKVSYNGIFEATKPIKIGVLPLGYYEGIPRDLSNKGVITYGNENLPIVGRICMNHIMFDLKNTSLQVGDEVTVISRDQSRANSINQISKNHGLFNYSLLTGLSNSIRRRIIA